MKWSDDNQLFDRGRLTLYTLVVGDILDSLEPFRQFFPQAVQPGTMKSSEL